jgi:hypothetical protein
MLLAAVGLEPVESRYIIFFPSERVRPRGLESRLGSVPLGAQHYVAGRR